MNWRETSIEGLVFGWRREGDIMHVELSSVGPGWVAVGFNNTPTLDGSRLFMAAVTDGGAVVEEHWTRPPEHGPVSNQSAVFGVEGEARLPEGGNSSLQSEKGGTWLGFSIRGIEPDYVHVTLAWSEHDDFQHHSRVRRMVSIAE